ncbi:MAG TPA: hypothetical protein VE074_12885 [Jatrophihabitantaceae bacterium]|nr:hypothetical protein [Jatrophihabitantaceae bacterium]
MSAPARVPSTRRAAPARPVRSTPSRSTATGWSQTRLVAAKAPQAVTRTGPRRAPFVLLIAGLLIGGLCALLALNTAAAAQELRRQSLTQANADSSDDVQQLKAQLAARQAPGALGSAAAALGMVPADHPAFLRILPNGTVKVMGSPQPATAAAPPPSPTPTPTPTHSKPNQHASTPAKKPTTPPAKKPTPTPTGGHR